MCCLLQNWIAPFLFEFLTISLAQNVVSSSHRGEGSLGVAGTSAGSVGTTSVFTEPAIGPQTVSSKKRSASVPARTEMKPETTTVDFKLGKSKGPLSNLFDTDQPNAEKDIDIMDKDDAAQTLSGQHGSVEHGAVAAVAAEKKPRAPSVRRRPTRATGSPVVNVESSTARSKLNIDDTTVSGQTSSQASSAPWVPSGQLPHSMGQMPEFPKEYAPSGQRNTFGTEFGTEGETITVSMVEWYDVKSRLTAMEDQLSRLPDAKAMVQSKLEENARQMSDLVSSISEKFGVLDAKVETSRHHLHELVTDLTLKVSELTETH